VHACDDRVHACDGRVRARDDRVRARDDRVRARDGRRYKAIGPVTMTMKGLAVRMAE
jgi:hypothetical protein